MIDTTFDFRSDSSGRDADIFSPTLRSYHQSLWSKPLPSGQSFALDVTTAGAYLHHRSNVGEFVLSSDTVVPTFERWVRLRPIIDRVSEVDRESFSAIRYTIGGMLIFPSNVVDRKPTINGARGFDQRIADRVDLTLEAIRRYYLQQASPLTDTFARYSSFFLLFGDFAGYVDFFLLQDLVTQGGAAVTFFLPFDDFRGPAVPTSPEGYVEYRQLAMRFIAARNERIASLGI